MPSTDVRAIWGVEETITSWLMSQNLFSSSLHGAQRASICFVCVEAVYVFYVLMSYYYFLVYLVLYVCIYGVRGGMHDTELLEDRGRGERIFVWPDQSNDVEPGGQGQVAFYKFMQILGKAFVDHTAQMGTAALSFCEFGFCYEMGLNKMAEAGQGEWLHVINEHVSVMCVSVKRVGNWDIFHIYCLQLLSFELNNFHKNY